MLHGRKPVSSNLSRQRVTTIIRRANQGSPGLSCLPFSLKTRHLCRAQPPVASREHLSNGINFELKEEKGSEISLNRQRTLRAAFDPDFVFGHHRSLCLSFCFSVFMLLFLVCLSSLIWGYYIFPYKFVKFPSEWGLWTEILNVWKDIFESKNWLDELSVPHATCRFD